MSSRPGKMAIRFGLIILLAIFAQGNGYDTPVPAKDQVFLTKRTTENFIIKGNDAEKGQFPYQIGMYMDKKSFCGGSLISPRWVLTAAHCIHGFSSFTVILGALNVSTPFEPGRIAINSRNATHHEKYDRNMLDNDVGVVNLPMDAPINDQINTISLPPRSFTNKDFVGQPVRVSGWGKLSDTSSWISSKLQFVDLTVVSNEKCKETYQDIISDKIVCAAGPDGKSPCNGDSGGPLVIKEESTNKTFHFAVVSFVSSEGCASGNPSGYDRTYKFLDWINTKTGITIQD